MNTGPHDELARGLEREADQFTRRGGTTLELSQVLDRAGEIRRGRRMRATMVMAACVLAIAVPTVLVAVNRDATHEPTPAPAPKVDTSPLSLSGLDQGPAPRTGYITPDAWHPPAGRAEHWAAQGRAIGVARVGDGFVVELFDDQGNQMAEVVADDSGAVPGRTHAVFDMSGGFAVSDGGKVVAFVKPDGTPVVVQDGGRTTYTMPRIPRGSGFDAVAVTGEDCKESDQSAGCTVWVDSTGQRPETWVSTSHGFADTAQPGLKSVVDVHAGELVAGFTKILDDGTCSAVERVGQDQPLWTTCDHRMVAFSPDGTKLLATNAYGDGIGDSQLAVYDAADGSVVVDLATAGQGFINRMVWEDDTHVLATVFENGSWAVLRVGLDGSREYALAPRTGQDVETPYFLPSR